MTRDAIMMIDFNRLALVLIIAPILARKMAIKWIDGKCQRVGQRSLPRQFSLLCGACPVTLNRYAMYPKWMNILIYFDFSGYFTQFGQFQWRRNFDCISPWRRSRLSLPICI